MTKLKTKVPVDECHSRLQATTDVEGLLLSWNSDGDSPKVHGEFRGRAFRLHTRRFYVNSFIPFFYGRLEPADGGTVIEGRFKMNPLIRLLTVFWFSFIAVFAVGTIIVPARRVPGPGGGRMTLFVALVCLAVVGAGVVQLGRWLGRREEGVILSFLKNSLEATEE